MWSLFIWEEWCWLMCTEFPSKLKYLVSHLGNAIALAAEKFAAQQDEKGE